jgi:hypothetical protein
VQRICVFLCVRCTQCSDPSTDLVKSCRGGFKYVRVCTCLHVCGCQHPLHARSVLYWAVKALHSSDFADSGAVSTSSCLRCVAVGAAVPVAPRAGTGCCHLCHLLAQEHTHRVVRRCLRCCAGVGAALLLVQEASKGCCHQCSLLVEKHTRQLVALCLRWCATVYYSTLCYSINLRWCGLAGPFWSRQGCINTHLCHLCFVGQAAAATQHMRSGPLQKVCSPYNTQHGCRRQHAWLWYLCVLCLPMYCAGALTPSLHTTAHICGLAPAPVLLL